MDPQHEYSDTLNDCFSALITFIERLKSDHCQQCAVNDVMMRLKSQFTVDLSKPLTVHTVETHG